MKVYLYNVGRNLNRAFRTCFSFGINELILIGNSADRSIQWELKGHLYAAKDAVKITEQKDLPDLSQTVGLENYYVTPIESICWEGLDSILIGGESTGLPKGISPKIQATIPTINSFCLTVEASLAIALYEWRRKCLLENK